MLDRRRFLSLAGLGAASLVLPRPAFAGTTVGFSDLYVREGQLTDTIQALAGQPIEMTGFMAPPLKALASFFVLTRMPMATCPFCETEAQWPDDIVLVLTPGEVLAIPFNRPIVVTGTLDLGFETDAETGFVSLIRIEDAAYRRA